MEVTLLAAFAAGFLSFVSPCVLPLIPGYISFISGLTLEEMQGKVEAKSSRASVVMASLAFVLGFTVIFVAMGASASAIGGWMSDHRAIIEKIAGTVLVVLGLHMMGVFRIRLL
jgi:cytochrome c-type biogenesis protein